MYTFLPDRSHIPFVSENSISGSLSPSTMQRIHSLEPMLREPVFIQDDIPRILRVISSVLENSMCCSEAKRDTVVLSAEALMTNALQYAGNGLFSLFGNHRSIYILMEDQGPGLDPSILMEAIHSPGMAAPHMLGKGLHKVHIASDKMAVYRDSNLTAVAAIFRADDNNNG